MSLAIRSRLAAFNVEARFLHARAIEATPSVNIHHAVRNMLHAIRSRRTALDAEARFLRAGIIQAILL